MLESQEVNQGIPFNTFLKNIKVYITNLASFIIILHHQAVPIGGAILACTVSFMYGNIYFYKEIFYRFCEENVHS